MALTTLVFPLSKKEHLIDWIIWNMLLYWLIIDCITGFFLNSGLSVPISQIYKLFLISILIFRVIKQGSGLGISLVILYVIVYFIHITIINESIPDSLIHLSKILLTFLIYIYLSNNVIVSSQKTFKARAYTILKISFVIFAINIVLGLFGIGYHTYPDEKIGYKGFFFAGNELGGLFAVLAPFYLYNIYSKLSSKTYFINCIFIIGLAILLGTKSVMIISIIVCFSIPWIYGNTNTKLYLIIIFITCIVLLIPFISELINSQESDLLIRLSYSYNKGGIMSLIFSSRDEFWYSKSIEFYNSNMLTKIFGLGGNRTVEMDQFDVLLNYGYLGLILVYSFYFKMFLTTWRNRDNNSYTKAIILSNMMLFAMSIIAGHILFSSMAGMYICINNTLSKIHKNTIH